MTGWYPHTRGHRTMYHMLHPEAGETNLLKLLKENNYFVWWGGKNDLVPAQDGFEAHCNVKHRPNLKRRDLHNADQWRGEKGSDTYYSFYVGKLEKNPDEEIYLDGDWANVLAAIDLIKNPPPEAKDKPLCIYLPLGYPHPPYGVEEPYYSLIDRNKIPPRISTPDWSSAKKPSILGGIAQKQNMQSWSEERWRELKATYLGMCARIDDQLGRIIQALKDANIYDDTAMFIFSDHGDFTGDYGLVEKTQNTFEDVLTRVPFLIKPPKNTPCQGRISEAMVELIDFPATVFALTGIDPGYSHFGRSLLPVLSGKNDDHRDAAFCEGGRLPSEEHTREKSSPSAVEGGLYWPRISLQLGNGPEHGKAVMCRTKDWKFVRRLYESDELYDLRTDPHEQKNLIDDPHHAPIATQLRNRLLTFMIETADVVPLKIDHRS
jgi:arylsulfatase A-like enzyme